MTIHFEIPELDPTWIISIAIVLYCIIGLATARFLYFADKEEGVAKSSDNEIGPCFVFGIFWPITLVLSALYVVVFIPVRFIITHKFRGKK